MTAGWKRRGRIDSSAGQPSSRFCSAASDAAAVGRTLPRTPRWARPETAPSMLPRERRPSTDAATFVDANVSVTCVAHVTASDPCKTLPVGTVSACGSGDAGSAVADRRPGNRRA